MTDKIITLFGGSRHREKVETSANIFEIRKMPLMNVFDDYFKEPLPEPTQAETYIKRYIEIYDLDRIEIYLHEKIDLRYFIRSIIMDYLR